MDNIAIDPSGQISVRSLIKHIMPQLHDSSVLRGAQRALTASGGSEMSTTLINGRLTKTATLDVLCAILDKMPGQKWREWRETSGPAFKQALRERVEGIIAAAREEGREPEQPVDEEQEEGVETKAVALRRALEAVNIGGSVRVDEQTGMVSVVDVIRMLCPDVSPEYAAQMHQRAIEKDDREPSLKSRVHYIKINEKGNTTPVTDFKTLVEIIWMLPTGASREFRRKSAETICRVMGGDISLCCQIEQNNLMWEGIDGGATIQRALLKPVEYKEECESGRVKECSVRDALASSEGGRVEVETPSGFIDVLSDTEVIEVKYYRKWKDGLGQVLAYQSHHPLLARRLHLFARTGDRDTEKYCELARSVCGAHLVRVTFEELVEQELEIDLQCDDTSTAVVDAHVTDQTYENTQGDDTSTIVGDERGGAHATSQTHEQVLEPFWFTYASIGDKRSYAQMQVLTSCKEKLESVGRFDEVAADEFADGVRSIQRRLI